MWNQDLILQWRNEGRRVWKTLGDRRQFHNHGTMSRMVNAQFSKKCPLKSKHVNSIFRTSHRLLESIQQLLTSQRLEHIRPLPLRAYGDRHHVLSRVQHGRLRALDDLGFVRC